MDTEKHRDETRKIRDWIKKYRLLDRKLRTAVMSSSKEMDRKARDHPKGRGVKRAEMCLGKLREVLRKEDVHDKTYLSNLKNVMDRTEMAILTFKENQKREWDNLTSRKHAIELDLERFSKRFQTWSKSAYIVPTFSSRRYNRRKQQHNNKKLSDERYDLGPRSGPGWHRADHDHFEKLVRKHRLGQYVKNQSETREPTKSKLRRLFSDIVKEIPNQNMQTAQDHWLWYLSYHVKLNHNKTLAKRWRERKNKELECERLKSSVVPSSSSLSPPSAPSKTSPASDVDMESKREAVKAWKRKQEREMKREKKRKGEEARKQKILRDKTESKRREENKRQIEMWRAEKQREERKQSRQRAFLRREREAREREENKETEWRIRKKFESYLDRVAEKGHVKRASTLLDDEELYLFHRMVERRKREQAEGLERRPCDPTKLAKPTMASRNMARPKGYSKSRQEQRSKMNAHDKIHHKAPSVFSARVRAVPSWRSGM